MARINRTIGVPVGSGMRLRTGWRALGITVFVAALGSMGIVQSVPLSTGHISGADNIAAPGIVNHPAVACSEVNMTVGSTPDQIVFDPTNGLLYVTNPASSNVSVISGATEKVVANFNVGPNPYGIAYDPVNGNIYIADNGYGGGNTLSLYSPVNHTVFKNVTVGFAPQGVLFDPANSQILVANGNSDNVTAISGTSNAVIQNISVGYNPWYMSFDSMNHDIYVPNGGFGGIHGSLGPHTISIIGPTDVVINNMSFGTAPIATVFDAANGYVYALNQGNNNITFINGQTNVVAPTSLSTPSPFVGVYDPSTGDVYITNGVGTPAVTVLSAATNDEIGTLPVGPSAGGIALDTQTGMLYVAANGEVTAISPSCVDYQYFTVSFTETGIPAKVLAKDGWTAALGGIAKHSSSSTVNFDETNGTYSDLIVGPAHYVTSQPTGTLTVNGAPVSHAVTFSKGRTVTLKFAERGLPKVRPWCVDLSGWTACQAGSHTKYQNLSAGNYSYAVTSPLAGQTITGKIGKTTVVLTGGATQTLDLTRSTTVGLTFAYPYAVTFSETGLTTGTWSITIKAHTETAAWNSPIQFNLTNGTYAYKIGAVTGYRSSGSPPKAMVSGAVTSVKVTFAKRT